METFFILAVIVFLPFGWFILRMLRYTNETIGEDSPLHKERTYQFSTSQYFSDFLRIANPILAVMMLVLAFITSKATIKQQEPLLFIFSLFFLGFAGFFCFVIYFDWQYWLITRNVLVIFNPLKSSITVDSPTQCCVLTSSNVIHIEEHAKDYKRVSKMLADYGFYLFYLTDGRIIQINNIFLKGFIYTEFLERFFPNTPHTIIWHRSMWTTDLNYAENLELPNFAA